MCPSPRCSLAGLSPNYCIYLIVIQEMVIFSCEGVVRKASVIQYYALSSLLYPNIININTPDDILLVHVYRCETTLS